MVIADMSSDTGARFGSPLWQALFAPESIALIGQSDNPKRPSGRPLRYLRRDGYKGQVYPINPRRETVQGETAYKDLNSLPGRPDQAYILLDTDLAMSSFAACCEASIPVVQVLADGFAESGHEGRERQEQLLKMAKDAGVRLLGPNCMGVADLNSGLSLTVNAVFDEDIERGGRVALISQSGSMMGGLMSRAASLGLKFSKIAAVGNEADLGVGEIGQMLIGDPETDVILLFLETIRRPDEIAKFASAAHAAGKPVIAFKLGRSSVGQQLAVAHTGALLSEDSLVDAFFRDLGIVRVTMLEALIEAATLCRGKAPIGKAQPKVGVITTTGGGGASACDQLSYVGVDLLTPNDDTVSKIRATGINVGRGPMTDVTLAGARADIIGPSVSAMAHDPDCDVVLAVLGSSSRAAPETALPPVIEADVGDATLAAFLVPDAIAGLKLLTEAGVPGFRTPESCADAIRAYCRWQKPRIRSIASIEPPTAQRTLNEHDSLRLFEEVGIHTVSSVAIAADEVKEANLPFDYPVVAKVLSDEIAHKTDAGGVIIGIADQDALIKAAMQIKQNVESASPGNTVERILIEPMVNGLQEVLVGYQLDEQVGPVVTVAPGGIHVGVYDDKSVRLAPVDLATAREMIDEVIGLAPLRGHRGGPLGDLEALATIIVAISRLAERQDIRVIEAEVNPVIVSTRGATAVDGLVRIAE